MDYLSRLVAGVHASPTRQAGYDTAQQRSIRFRGAYDQLQQIWRKNNASHLLASAVSVLTCLESIRRLLQDELYTPAPHLCARHVSTFQVYKIIVQVTSNYPDELIIHETLDIIKTLIDSEEVDFAEETGFADALIGLVGKLSSTGASVDSEDRIAEILFSIASKIRLQPRLLPIWFRLKPTSAGNTIDLGKSWHTVKAESDVFPLFCLMLKYVHHDERVGDFARTGLLYLIESATTSEALEKWIVESDLATLMASGLGALYSQLSRKLVLSFPKDSVPAIVTFSEAATPQLPYDGKKTTSSDFRSHLATFLSYLVFWQDVLEHCRSEDIRRSLLDHFKFLFLQQLLYPSLIESSDADGGSSVAVLTYLRCIIESIDHAELLYMTLHYLLALPEKMEDESKQARPTTLARRRKSSMLITNLAQGSEKPMPDLFTLVDLILTSLKSQNQQTVAATLQLVSVILQRHHQYAVSSIVKTQPLSDDLTARTIHAHRRDTETLFSMAEDLVEHDELREMYEEHLEDARTLVESHCCSTVLFSLPGSSVGNRLGGVSEKEYATAVRFHSIRADDPLTNSMVSLLKDFLANDINTNLRLTQSFATLASCGNTCLDHWLLGDPCPDQSICPINDLGDSDQDDTITVPAKAETETRKASFVENEDSRPKTIDSPRHLHAPSPVFITLDSLVQQVERFRHDIKEFDTYLAERRHIFKVGEDIDKAVANDVPLSQRSGERNSAESPTISNLRIREADQLISLSQRLLSETPSSNISRSSSPRGRQPSESLSSTPVGRSSHLRISPSPSPTQPASRVFSASPLREGSYTSTLPKGVVTPAVPADPLLRRLRIKVAFGHQKRDVGSSETSSIRSGLTSAEVKITETAVREVTLSHLLTNVIILQEFILELAAIVEVRASLFGEVKFI